MIVTLQNLTAAVNSANAAAAAPEGYNGGIGTISLHKPTDYVNDWGKIVLDVANNTLDTRGTLRWLFYVAQNKPTEDVAITEDHLAQVIPRAINLLARVRVYTTMSYFNLDMDYRMSDTVNLAGIANGLVALRSVDEFYALLLASENIDVKIAQVANFIWISFFANGIHRKICDHHSWFTPDTNRRGTNTNRCCDVAGSQKREFTAWMAENAQGHDGNHHLPDEKLFEICDALCGAGDFTGRGGGVDPPTYAGEAVAGRPLHAVVQMTESCTDRWPPGQMGKAALIVGLDMVIAMIAHICMRLKVQNAAAITTNAETALAAIKEATFSREGLTSMNNALQSIISMAKGYVLEANIYEPGTHGAFESHGGRAEGKVTIGKGLAQTVAAATPHSEAVSAAVASMLGSVATALDAAAAIQVEADGGGEVPLVANMQAVDVANIDVQVGVSNADRMMEMFMANGGPNAGGGGNA